MHGFVRSIANFVQGRANSRGPARREFVANPGTCGDAPAGRDGTRAASRRVRMDESGRVLVVDDEEGPRESLRMLLKGEHRVTTAARGSEALRLLREESFDVVLLDLTMPDDLSGTESLRAIRAAGLDVEALVVTGQGTLETAVECLRLGARDYIAKPFHGPAVLAAVRAALSARATRRRAGELRGHLLGNLSHEFRTPLHAIVGYSEILDEEAGERLDGSHREALGRIRRCSERLLSYLEGLLFLAEAEGGRLAPRPAPFDVAAWLPSWLAIVREEAHRAGGSVEVTCEPGLVARGDARALGRLMGVLAFEALARRPGARVVVRASAPRHDEWAIDVLAAGAPAGLEESAGSSLPGGDASLPGRDAGPWGGGEV
ncbi:MAG: hybrid sensor histidine kinase/response regulator, partial [Alphaproteobacteria bacterium]